MQHSWTSLVGLGACSLFSVVLLADDSWARPKKPTTYYECKCTCMWEDELGKEHFGPSGAVQFTESTGERCLGHKCTTNTGTGIKQGTTRDCRVTEKSNQMRIPPGGIHGQVQQTPTPPGTMRAPIPGTIHRRGIEGEEPTSSEKEGK